MRRAEFKKQTRRAALQRSGGRCEATGIFYGLPVDQRCGTPLVYGVEFDHIILDANSHDNSLSNCAAICKRCHRWKTAHRDAPLAAKTLRQQDKHRGVKGTKRGFRGWRKFNGDVVWRDPAKSVRREA